MALTVRRHDSCRDARQLVGECHAVLGRHDRKGGGERIGVRCLVRDNGGERDMNTRLSADRRQQSLHAISSAARRHSFIVHAKDRAGRGIVGAIGMIDDADGPAALIRRIAQQRMSPPMSIINPLRQGDTCRAASRARSMM